MASWTHSRSALAVAVRRGEPPETVALLRRDYAADRAEHYLRELVQRDPPLTRPQLASLADILTAACSSGPDGGEHAAT
jgi:hypothetical protein